MFSHSDTDMRQMLTWIYLTSLDFDITRKNSLGWYRQIEERRLQGRMEKFIYLFDPIHQNRHLVSVATPRRTKRIYGSS